MKSVFRRSVFAFAAAALLAGASSVNAQQADKPLKKYESGTKEFLESSVG